MCYWVIYVEDRDNGDKLVYSARPFSDLEGLHDWINNTKHIVAISITQSIYRDSVKEDEQC